MVPHITVQHVASSRLPQVDFDDLAFGMTFTDHMFVADYRDGEWQDARIEPYGPFQMDPSNLALHYGQSVFEGMKATKTAEGDVTLWRPEMHAKRINRSAARLMMQTVPEELFLAALHRLVDLDRDWVPPKEGSALYLRPFLFATDTGVGVRPSQSYRFCVLACPVGPYYAKPVSLLAETTFVRAAIGGVGEAKAAGNYAASLLPVHLAQQQGCDQVLWLDAKEFKYVQEVGTMNIFFVINGVVVTPETDGAILHGITRDGLLRILADNDMPHEVRRVSIDEIVAASKDGTLEECFGAGTAAIVSMVKSIKVGDYTITLPPVEKAVIAAKLKDRINGIRGGRYPDTYGWMTEVAVQEQQAVAV